MLKKGYMGRLTWGYHNFDLWVNWNVIWSKKKGAEGEETEREIGILNLTVDGSQVAT